MSLKYAAVILAAGCSSRLGHPKQLVCFQEEFLVNRTIRLVKSTGINDISLVVGFQKERIIDVLSHQVTQIEAKQWQQGMGNSLHSGLAVQSLKHLDGILITTCDLYRIQAHDYQALLDCHSKNPQHYVVASYQNTWGNPLIIPPTFLQHIHLLSGKRGAKPLITSLNGVLKKVLMENAQWDLDTPEDLVQLRQYEKRN
ncbi:MAG: nucleotidyltransferase family protein [Pseudomonadota bacterium]